MLKVGCMMCKTELQEPGAILFASPTEEGLCAKYHICVKCEKILVQFLTEKMLKRLKLRRVK